MLPQAHTSPVTAKQQGVPIAQRGHWKSQGPCFRGHRTRLPASTLRTGLFQVRLVLPGLDAQQLPTPARTRHGDARCRPRGSTLDGPDVRGVQTPQSSTRDLHGGCVVGGVTCTSSGCRLKLRLSCHPQHSQLPWKPNPGTQLAQPLMGPSCAPRLSELACGGGGGGGGGRLTCALWLKQLRVCVPTPAPQLAGLSPGGRRPSIPVGASGCYAHNTRSTGVTLDAIARGVRRHAHCCCGNTGFEVLERALRVPTPTPSPPRTVANEAQNARGHGAAH